MNVYDGERPMAWLLAQRSLHGAQEDGFSRVTALLLEFLNRCKGGRVYLCAQDGHIACVLKQTALDIAHGELPDFLYRMSLADRLELWGWAGESIVLAATVENVLGP